MNLEIKSFSGSVDNFIVVFLRLVGSYKAITHHVAPDDLFLVVKDESGFWFSLDVDRAVRRDASETVGSRTTRYSNAVVDI